jgi:hypothetical protein
LAKKKSDDVLAIERWFSVLLNLEIALPVPSTIEEEIWKQTRASQYS